MNRSESEVTDRLAQCEARSFGEEAVTGQGESGEFKYGWPVV